MHHRLRPSAQARLRRADRKRLIQELAIALVAVPILWATLTIFLI